MATYTARVKYVDVREILIEADSDEEAQTKYVEGDWEDETTIDFYSDEELRPLTRSEG